MHFVAKIIIFLKTNSFFDLNGMSQQAFLVDRANVIRVRDGSEHEASSEVKRTARPRRRGLWDF